MSEVQAKVEVSRRIEVTAPTIFLVLASPHRHQEFDGSGMLRAALSDELITRPGGTFTVKMHRLGRDYEMINHVVAFESNRLIAWEPSPGDLDTAGGDVARIGVPSGYRWGFRLEPESDDSTLVTEFFDCGPAENHWILEGDGGSWINGYQSVRESMTRTLALLEEVCRQVH